MKRLQYGIQGMNCAACVSHVEREVARVLDADDQFTVSLLTNSLSVTLGKELGDAELELLEHRLSASIRAAGYRLQTEPPKPQKNDRSFQKRLWGLIVSAIFTLALMYISMGSMIGLPAPSFLSGDENALFFALAQLILTLPVVVINFGFFRRGISALVHLAPNMDSLIAVGSGASLIYGIIAIFAIGSAKENPELLHAWLHDLYFESAAMILTLVSLGKLLESRAKDKASDAVRSLAKLSPKFATVLRDGKETSIPTEEIVVGDLLLVRAGEPVPVDGDIVNGEGSADESALTGESMPVDKQTGDRVFAACTLTSGALTVRASRVGEDTSLSRLVRLLEDAAASKPKLARIADRVSAVFVPAVMAISVVTFVLWMVLTSRFSDALRAAISVLVISCPCALGLATPTAITVGIGRGAKYGILFRNAEALEKLASVQTVVFDKTGTVTEGRPVLSDLYAYGCEPDEVLTLAAAVEHLSSHPLAMAIYGSAVNRELKIPTTEQFESRVGVGASGIVNGHVICVGKPEGAFAELLRAQKKVDRSLTDAGVADQQLPVVVRRDADLTCAADDFYTLEQMGKTAVAVTKDGETVGILGISDAVRTDAVKAVESLRHDGIFTCMLTGDNERTAAHVARAVGLDDYRASLLPEDKERMVGEWSAKSPTAMVGDGINDAPALARADVGIAIGGGTEIAIESADVVLSQSSLTGVAAAHRLSRATIRIIKQNLFWALFYNALCIPVAAGALYPVWGISLSPMLASAAMSLSSVCVVTNALRLFRVRLFDRGEDPIMNEKSVSAACPLPSFAPSPESQPDLSLDSQNLTHTKGDQTMLFSKKAKSETYVIGVEGMMCPRCVAHVKKALEEVEGVSSVEVSLENKNATVTASAPLSALTAAIVAAGYEVV